MPQFTSLIEIQATSTSQGGADRRSAQRWKKGWSTGALLPEGNGQDHSCQKDLGQVYRACCDFYKMAIFRTFAVGPIRIDEHILKYRKIPSAEEYKNKLPTVMNKL